jgi:hypothetical protein
MIQNRTLDDYKRAGAWMRLLKAVLAKTYIECSKVMRVGEYEGRFESVIRKVDNVCSRAEDNMFRDFPEISNQHVAVFYGTPDGKYRSDVDKEQTELMIKLVKDLFKDNWE